MAFSGCLGYICDWQEAEKVYNCEDKDLTSVPWDTPAETEILKLADNKISSIPSGSFDNITALKKLDLEDNSFEVLTVGMFKGLGTLETLILSENYVYDIGEGVFEPLSNLETLEMEFTVDLEVVAKDAFKRPGKTEGA